MKILPMTLTLLLSSGIAMAGTAPVKQEQPAPAPVKQEKPKPSPAQQSKPAPVQQAKPKPNPAQQSATPRRTAENVSRQQFLRQARLNREARIARRAAARARARQQSN